MSVVNILKKAVKLCRKGRHVAILFKGNRIVEHAYNQPGKTKAVCRRYSYTRDRPHAEFAVILKFIRTHQTKELHRLSMMVLRWDGSGKVVVSWPCDTCLQVLQWFGIRGVYAISNFDHALYRVLQTSLNWALVSGDRVSEMLEGG